MLTRQWLPADPICHLAVLIQGAMPPAQNLVVIMQLRASTQALAERYAQLIVRIYALSVAVVAGWTVCFCAVAGVSI